MRIFLASLLLLIFSSPAFANDEPDEDLHSEFHNTYKTWKTPTGESCCNDQDCMPIDHIEVVRDGKLIGFKVHIVIVTPGGRVFDKWWDVPNSAVRPYNSPDYGAHACYKIGWKHDPEKKVLSPHPIFYCFVPPRNS